MPPLLAEHASRRPSVQSRLSGTPAYMKSGGSKNTSVTYGRAEAPVEHRRPVPPPRLLASPLHGGMTRPMKSEIKLSQAVRMEVKSTSKVPSRATVEPHEPVKLSGTPKMAAGKSETKGTAARLLDRAESPRYSRSTLSSQPGVSPSGGGSLGQKMPSPNAEGGLATLAQSLRSLVREMQREDKEKNLRGEPVVPTRIYRPFGR